MLHLETLNFNQWSLHHISKSFRSFRKLTWSEKLYFFYMFLNRQQKSDFKICDRANVIKKNLGTVVDPNWVPGELQNLQYDPKICIY